jgi:hypothetical protein
MKKVTSGAKARTTFSDWVARLKVVPFPVPVDTRVFPCRYESFSTTWISHPRCSSRPAGIPGRARVSLVPIRADEDVGLQPLRFSLWTTS